LHPASAPLSSPHLPFAGLRAQAPVAEKRLLEGSSLYIHCPYTPQTGHQQKKAWCRMRGDKCEPLVETSGGPTTYPYTIEATKGKIKIVDHHYYETVSITMTNLQAEDSGTYSCAHRSNSNQYIPFRTISLIVSKEKKPLPQPKYLQIQKTSLSQGSGGSMYDRPVPGSCKFL
uniref:Ig-like domain-containing protein n=1 Tax=Calidris pygmaea TaxID=425635 RepID=A0A8C3PSY5_9CHAR